MDERIERAVDRLGEQVEEREAFDRIAGRKTRRRAIRRVQVAALASVTVAGTVVGVLGLARVLRFPGESIPPGSSATNGLIAFQFTRLPDFDQPDGEPEFDIYVANPDGSELHNLTPDEAEYMSPAWSPDGRKLAVLRFQRDGESFEEGIYLMNGDGSRLRKLHSTGLMVPISVLQLGWSPDGSRLGFIRIEWPTDPGPHTEADAVTQLVVMNADGTGVRTLTDSAEQVHSFAWSPDGQQIVFTRQFLATETRFGYDLFVMNADGTGVHWLTDDGRSLNPAWSPDGTQIAFVSWERGDDIRGRDIYVMKSDGTGRTRLTYDGSPEDDPTWSPDGTMILFSRFRARGDCPLMVVEPDGVLEPTGPVPGPTPTAGATERTLLSSEGLGGCLSHASWQGIVPE